MHRSIFKPIFKSIPFYTKDRNKKDHKKDQNKIFMKRKIIN